MTAEQTPVRQAPSAKRCNVVIEMLNDEREQILAIAFALVNQLKPRNDEDLSNLNEYRLAEVITDILSSTTILTAAREMLGCEGEK